MRSGEGVLSNSGNHCDRETRFGIMVPDEIVFGQRVAGLY